MARFRHFDFGMTIGKCDEPKGDQKKKPPELPDGLFLFGQVKKA
jgi:hypothetical protein